MNNTKASILAKSTSSSASSADTQETIYNTVTMEALQETSNVMNGKKKVKWNCFQPGISKSEAAKELEKILDS